MVKLKDGDIFKWPWGLQDPVSYSMDTEISAPYPESWRERLPGQAFSEDYEEYAGMQDSRIQHNEGSHTHGNDNTAKVCSV